MYRKQKLGMFRPGLIGKKGLRGGGLVVGVLISFFEDLRSTIDNFLI